MCCLVSLEGFVFFTQRKQGIKIATPSFPLGATKASSALEDCVDGTTPTVAAPRSYRRKISIVCSSNNNTGSSISVVSLIWRSRDYWTVHQSCAPKINVRSPGGSPPSSSSSPASIVELNNQKHNKPCRIIAVYNSASFLELKAQAGKQAFWLIRPSLLFQRRGATTNNGRRNSFIIAKSKHETVTNRILVGGRRRRRRSKSKQSHEFWLRATGPFSVDICKQGTATLSAHRQESPHSSWAIPFEFVGGTPQQLQIFRRNREGKEQKNANDRKKNGATLHTKSSVVGTEQRPRRPWNVTRKYWPTTTTTTATATATTTAVWPRWTDEPTDRSKISHR